MLADRVDAIVIAGDRIVTLGVVLSEVSRTLRVILIICDAERLEESVTLAVTLLTPVSNGSDAIIQLADPSATADPPRSLTAVTRKVPDPPDADPEMVTPVAVVIRLVRGLVMLIEGAGAGAGASGVGVGVGAGVGVGSGVGAGGGVGAGAGGAPPTGTP